MREGDEHTHMIYVLQGREKEKEERKMREEERRGEERRGKFDPHVHRLARAPFSENEGEARSFDEQASKQVSKQASK